MLIYSDSEEIVLNKDEDFFVVAEKEEEFMFKLSLKKWEETPQKIDFCFNVTTDDIYFDKLEIFNNATISYIKDENGMNCYRYVPDEKFNNLNEKDIDIIFNIQALKDVNFVLRNNLIYLKSNEIGEKIEIPSFSFPYYTNFLILNSDSDLLFNLYLNDNNDNNYQGLNLSKVEIGYTILNYTYATAIHGQEIKILEGSIIETLDKATHSCVIKISKEYIKEFIKDDNKTQYYIHLVIVNNDMTANDNKNINARMFLLEKGVNNEIIIDKNVFISDKLILDNNNIFNLYHIKMENNQKVEIKFSSNYPLDDKFLIYLLEYNNNTNIDINYIEQNQKSYTNSSIGQIYTLLFDYNNQDPVKPDILLAVVSKLDKKNINLQTINYIFKYNIFTNDGEYDKRPKYAYNENYYLTKENDKYIIEFDSIKKNNNALKKNEIYIRQILDNKKILEESLATFAKIESKNSLIKIEKKEEKGDKTIITLNPIDTENFSFSILIDNLQENEKFILSNKTEIIPPESDTSTPDDGGNTDDDGKPKDGDNSLVLKIVIPIVVVIILIAVILILLTIKKRRGRELNMQILKTSFKEGERGLTDENFVNSEEY